MQTQPTNELTQTLTPEQLAYAQTEVIRLLGVLGRQLNPMFDALAFRARAVAAINPTARPVRARRRRSSNSR
jgi:hypothetical protein